MPYSDHSSFAELGAFMAAARPRRALPVVAARRHEFFQHFGTFVGGGPGDAEAAAASTFAGGIVVPPSVARFMCREPDRASSPPLLAAALPGLPPAAGAAAVAGHLRWHLSGGLPMRAAPPPKRARGVVWDDDADPAAPAPPPPPPPPPPLRLPSTLEAVAQVASALSLPVWPPPDAAAAISAWCHFGPRSAHLPTCPAEVDL